MGEEFLSDDVAHAPSSMPSSPGGDPSKVPESGEVPRIEPWPVVARKPLTAERIVKASSAEAGSEQALRVLAIHDTMRERTLLYAHQMELLCSFLSRDPAAAGGIDEADISAMKVATGLRVSTSRAECLIRDAHRTVELLPATFEVLTRGELPEDFHQHLLRKVRSLTPAQTRIIDEHVSSWDLASISRDQFVRHLGALVAMVTAGTLPTPPEAQRRVDIQINDPETGTATLCVTGPVLEIKDLAHRLDQCAHTVQKAQRHALELADDGTEIPFDLDSDLRDRGKPLTLAALRYAILTQSLLRTDPVQETRTSYRLLVTVPALTLLGLDNAPGMLEGLTPIPAEQARALAAGQATWQRILTDPATGAYLPVNAETYTPTKQMRLQLRLRHPACAAPGCTTPTVLASEDDHIEEYDHDHPERGGPTSLFNLHRLCWHHHTLKTTGHIDPERDPATSSSTRAPSVLSSAGADDQAPAPPLIELTPPRPRNRHPRGVEPTSTRWALDRELCTTTRENVDLLTPIHARALSFAWEQHLRAHDDATDRAEELARQPRRDRIIRERRRAQNRLRRPRPPRLPGPGPTGPEQDYGDDPPF